MNCGEEIKNANNAIATISCGTETVAFIDLLQKIRHDIPLVFIDTGFHFRETLEYFETLQKFYPKLKFIKLISPNTHRYHKLLPASDLKTLTGCCFDNKSTVLYQYIYDNKIDTWISGIRQSQTKSRADKKKMETTDSGILKLYPIVEWSDKMVNDYIKTHNLPVHPLSKKGYYSIGCEPCTKKATDRNGRWCGIKSECGLHT